MSHFTGFSTWSDVLAYARTGAPLYYHAPMDAFPVRIFHFKVRARTIRIWPPGSQGRGRMRTADPFTADKGHLNRFRRPAESGSYTRTRSTRFGSARRLTAKGNAERRKLAELKSIEIAFERRAKLVPYKKNLFADPVIARLMRRRDKLLGIR